MKSFRRMLVTALVILLAMVGLASAMERRLLKETGGPFNLSGFRDADSGELTIPFRFERAQWFSEDLAAVCDKGLWGYVDASGAWAIPPRFEASGDFHNGLAAVQLDNFVGVIDRTGNIVIDPQFERVEPFTSNIVIATAGKVGAPGKAYTGPRRGLYQIGRGWISDASLDISPFDPERELFWARPKREKLTGIMRVDGSWFLEPRFEWGERLRLGVALVHETVRSAAQPTVYLTGAIDANGELVLPLEDWNIQYVWDSDYYIVRRGQSVGRIYGKGRLIGNRLFDEIEPANGGYAVRIGDTWNFVGDDGALSPLRDDAFDRPLLGSGLILRRVATRQYRILGPDGAATTPETFDFVGAGDFSKGSPFAAKLAGEARWGFIGAQGRPVGPGFAFERVSNFVEDRALVKMNGKWGLIDRSGGFVIDPAFNALRPAGYLPPFDAWLANPQPKSEGASAAVWRLFIGEKDGQAVALDRDGVEQSMPPGEGLTVPEPPKSPLETRTGLLFAAADGLWGIKDHDGKWIVPPKYRAMHGFWEGVAWAPIDEKRRWCPVGPDGVARDKPACVIARMPDIPTHTFPEKLDEDPYESSVLWQRAYLEFLAGVRAQGPSYIGDGVRGGKAIHTMTR